jgi:hypothetical protein
MASSPIKAEIAAGAARLVVEEGLEYGPAKRRAVKQLGLPTRSELPGNEAVEEEVFSYLALFCADTQPLELLTLRKLALIWMQRLTEFRPHLSGAVWRGTATRLSDIHIQLYCDDPKVAEITIINQRLDYDIGSTKGPRGIDVDVLTLATTCPEFNERVLIHLSILDLDDLRGALKADSRGRTDRGDISALGALLTLDGEPCPS